MGVSIELGGAGGGVSDLSPTDEGSKQVLQEFYAVTDSGEIYLVVNRMCPDRLTPVAQVIATATTVDLDSLAVGYQLGGVAGCQCRIGVTVSRGIVVYLPRDYEGKPPTTAAETMGFPGRFGGHTFPIVGLFLTRMDAKECLEHSDLKKWDKRWIGHTRVTIEFIGKSHPLFRVDTDVYDKLQQ